MADGTPRRTRGSMYTKYDISMRVERWGGKDSGLGTRGRGDCDPLGRLPLTFTSARRGRHPTAVAEAHASRPNPIGEGLGGACRQGALRVAKSRRRRTAGSGGNVLTVGRGRAGQQRAVCMEAGSDARLYTRPESLEGFKTSRTGPRPRTHGPSDAKCERARGPDR